MTTTKSLTTIDRLLHRTTGLLAWAPGLITRVSVGMVFVESGWGKLHNIPKVAAFFTDLGLPAPVFQAHLVSTTEFVSGLLLVAGLLTRFASIPLLIIMFVALLTAKKGDISSFDDLIGLTEYTYLLLLLWLMIFGAGAVSLDRLLASWLHRKK